MADCRLWILGAADVEMAAIERLLTDAGERIAYALVGDNRVHPGNAYRADDTDAARRGETVSNKVYWVECGPADGHVIVGGSYSEVRIDHHRPGDPGYGRPPADYLEASSIGQVMAILSGEVGLPAAWGEERYMDGDFGILLDMRTRRSYGIDGACESKDAWGIIPTQQVMFVAAADHCLEAAYRGLCQGVDPEALMRWRVEQRAQLQGRPVEAVMADVEAARKRLCEATDPDAGADSRSMDALPLTYADLRGESIPELPEAAVREGIPFLATVRDRDGREKVVLQSVPQGSDLVQRFMRGEIVPDLVDYYGDPARGFAGGYLPRQ